MSDFGARPFCQLAILSNNKIFLYGKEGKLEGATTFSIMILSIMGLFATLSIFCSIEHHNAECCYAECRDYLNVTSDIMPSVMAPVPIR